MIREQQLIERCRQGDLQAGEELYHRTSARIYALLRRLTGNDEDAFDLTQETYVQALRGLHRFNGKSSFATWLYRIAYNQAMRFFERSRRGGGQNSMLQEPVQSGPPKHLADARADIQEALARLDPQDRSLLLLRYQGNLSYRELAELLECAEGTVASRLHRAREGLREILKNSYPVMEETAPMTHPKVGCLRPEIPPAGSRKPAP